MSTKAISLENATALYKDVRDRLYLIKDEYVPLARKINNMPLTDDITLTAIDVGAVRRGIQINNQILADSSITLSASNVGAYTKEEVDALIPTIPTSLPASDVYAWAKASSKPTYTASEVGAVPTSRTVNGKPLSGNITLSASDVGASKVSYQHNSTSVSAMSVGELKIVGFFTSYGATQSVKLPSGGTYYVVGITESSDYNDDWFASGETGQVHSGGTTITIYGYNPWVLVYRVS